MVRKKNKPIIPVVKSSSPKNIDAGKIPSSVSIPNPNVKPKPSKWYFGFQFFAQIRYFEIGGVDNGWFVSLITRLKEISQMDRDKFLRDFSQHKNIRYHEINWNSKNVPIQRSDLNWISKDYLDNEAEYPMLQFHISKALGRIVGFWDEYNVFQVVLLDPKHNIQPSNFNNYHVDDTYLMSCEYSSLLIDINKVKSKIKVENGCSICAEIKKLPAKLNDTNFVFGYLDDDYTEKLNTTKMTLTDIIELGLLSERG
jgi:hypothetical protein